MLLNHPSDKRAELRTGKLVKFSTRNFGVYIQLLDGKQLILTPKGEMIFNLEDYKIEVICATAMTQCAFTSLQEVEKRFDEGEFAMIFSPLK